MSYIYDFAIYMRFCRGLDTVYFTLSIYTSYFFIPSFAPDAQAPGHS